MLWLLSPRARIILSIFIWNLIKMIKTVTSHPTWCDESTLPGVKATLLFHLPPILTFFYKTYCAVGAFQTIPPKHRWLLSSEFFATVIKNSTLYVAYIEFNLNKFHALNILIWLGKSEQQNHELFLLLNILIWNFLQVNFWRAIIVKVNVGSLFLNLRAVEFLWA